MDHTADPGSLTDSGSVRSGEHSYVLAVAWRADERTRVLKHGETFGVFDRYGDIVHSGMGDHGLYHAGARHLSQLGLSLNGVRPLLLGSGMRDDTLSLVVDLTNADLFIDGQLMLPRGTLHVHRTAMLWHGVLFQLFSLEHYGARPAEFTMSLGFHADFADMFEVRGVRRSRRGSVHGPVVNGRMVRVEYLGLDGVCRSTEVSCDAEQAVITPSALELAVRLEPGERRDFEVRFGCKSGDNAPPPGVTYDFAVRDSRIEAAEFEEFACDIRTSSERCNLWINRSRNDLRLMTTQTHYGPYPYAGVPWFSTPFGRDGLITALEALWFNPALARGVLKFLAATQAEVDDPSIDAEPGKILHEMRQGEMAAIGEVPYARYYGSVDATPLFVVLAGEYLHTTGDMDLIRSLWPNIQRALSWLDGPGDLDGDGFIEYRTRSPDGLVNQGWKDSRDAVYHDDGTMASPPIALCEAQAYAYAARRAGSDIARALGVQGFAAELDAQAHRLREEFERRFWDDSLHTYVIALDGDKRPCRIAASNAGHCLYAGIARDDRADVMITDFRSERFFNGWGIRTVAADQPCYNPMSYHNGSVWPHDTAIVAAGMARYGRASAAASIFGAMLDVATYVDLHRLPELFCGFQRRKDEGPIRYPVACSPQSWAAGAVFMLIQACLGLTIRAERREVQFVNPQLPPFLQFIRLRNLRVGAACVDLQVQRNGDDVNVHILKRPSSIRLTVTR